LIRSLVSHLLSKDVEAFKRDLQSKADGELERLRYSLRLTAAEHENRVALLQSRRAEVIAEVYALMVDFLDAAREAFCSGKAAPATQDAVWRIGSNLRISFNKNQIYFSPRVSLKVRDFLDEINVSGMEYSLTRGSSSNDFRASIYGRVRDAVNADAAKIMGRDRGGVSRLIGGDRYRAVSCPLRAALERPSEEGRFFSGRLRGLLLIEDFPEEGLISAAIVAIRDIVHPSKLLGIDAGDRPAIDSAGGVGNVSAEILPTAA
jgi:hypothetical protein